jgi:hypothetical protein
MLTVAGGILLALAILAILRVIVENIGSIVTFFGISWVVMWCLVLGRDVFESLETFIFVFFPILIYVIPQILTEISSYFDTKKRSNKLCDKAQQSGVESIEIRQEEISQKLPKDKIIICTECGAKNRIDWNKEFEIFVKKFKLPTALCSKCKSELRR